MDEIDTLPSTVGRDGETCDPSLNAGDPSLEVITDSSLDHPNNTILVTSDPVDSCLDAQVGLHSSANERGESMVESTPIISTGGPGDHLHHVDVDSEAVSIPGSSEQEVIGMLLQSHENGTTSTSDAGDHGLDVSVSLPEGGIIPVDSNQGLMQAVTLADGSTAFIQHQKGASKFLEGQTVTLEDGSFAVVQPICPTEKIQAPAVEVHGTKFVDGQAVQLEDGTTAYIHSTPKEGLQAIQLEDGTTAYIAHSVADGLFTDAGSLDVTPISLEQLACQVQTTGDPSHSSTLTQDENKAVPTTISIISASPGRITSEKSFTMTDKAFKCVFDGCGRLYTTLHHLKVHERSHTGDRPFKCEHLGCGKAFATGYGLKSHTRVHTGEKPYKCPEKSCDKAFKTSGDLQKHVRTHTGERPFKCPFEGCERSFTTSNIRKVHIRTHTGERPYICNEEGCGRAFASATNYKNHIRIHTGEKPYVCTVDGCNKRFTEYSSLYKHHVVHTHSKPYECNHCGKNYRQTSTLAMHKRTAHNEDITAEAEAQMFSQHHVECNGDMGLPSKRSRLEFSLTNQTGIGDGPPGQSGNQEGPLITNSAVQQVTMVTPDGSTVGAEDQAMAAAIQASQQAAQAALIQQLQQQGLTSVTVGDSGQQIYVVTDPAHLEALQQFAVQQQQLEIHPTTSDSVNLGPVVSQSPSDGSVVVASGEGTVIPGSAEGALISFHTE